MPARVIETAEHYEPAMRGVEPPGGQWIGVAGLDLVRDADGEFLVLEDNLMTPSGFAYAAAARDAVLARARPGARRGRAATTSCRRCWPARCERGAPGDERAVPRRAHRRAGERRATGSTRGRRERSACRSCEPGDLQLDGDRLRHGGRARRRRLPAHERRPARHRRSARCSARRSRAGTVGVVNAFGVRRRRRQAHARVRRGHGALLPRRGAARALGPDARPRAARPPRAGARHVRRPGDQAARRPRRHRRDDLPARRARPRSRRCANACAPTPREWVAQPLRGALDAPHAGRRRALAASCRPATVRLHARPRPPARAAGRPDAVRASTRARWWSTRSQNGGFKDTWVLPAR